MIGTMGYVESDRCRLRTALQNIKKDKNILKRHEIIANATRKALCDVGISLHLQDGYSNTVTVFDVPKGVNTHELLEK